MRRALKPRRPKQNWWWRRGEELKKAEEKSRLTILRAPVDGVAQQLAVYTVGAVVKPADALLVVVPKSAELVVEAMVLNRDAGFVHERIEVRLAPIVRHARRWLTS